MLLNSLLKNIDSIIESEVDYLKLEAVKNFTTDKMYFKLIAEKSNGGYFFNNSLHIYGYCNNPKSHDSNYINKIINQEYQGIIGNMFCFGQDIFGNQFGFENNKVFSFNIETGEKVELAGDFNNWLKNLFNDLDYLTGESFVNLENKSNLKNGRLCPKTPFVIGGAYNNENFYLLPFPNYIKVNANIARQVYNLEEGTEIKIKTID